MYLIHFRCGHAFTNTFSVIKISARYTHKTVFLEHLFYAHKTFNVRAHNIDTEHIGSWSKQILWSQRITYLTWLCYAFFSFITDFYLFHWGAKNKRDRGGLSKARACTSTLHSICMSAWNGLKQRFIIINIATSWFDLTLASKVVGQEMCSLSGINFNQKKKKKLYPNTVHTYIRRVCILYRKSSSENGISCTSFIDDDNIYEYIHWLQMIWNFSHFQYIHVYSLVISMRWCNLAKSQIME